MKDKLIAVEKSFRQGYSFGRIVKRDHTMREISQLFPNVQDKDAFIQGMLDGIKNDRFRLDLKNE